jgi:hypothetical protein
MHSVNYFLLKQSLEHCSIHPCVQKGGAAVAAVQLDSHKEVLISVQVRCAACSSGCRTCCGRIQRLRQHNNLRGGWRRCYGLNG